MAGKADIKAGRAFVELFVKGAQFEAGLRAASAKLKGFGESMTQLGQKLAQLGVSASIGIGLSAKRFADFDDQMRTVGAVTQTSDEELQRLTETALKLGATTSYTAVQVAALMTELGRAGFSADQVNKMTGAVINLARASGTDATLASEIMTAAIHQYGLAAEDATRVSDALTVAANKSANTVEQLGEALSYTGPVAKDFNMSLEDTLAILGGLGNIGIQASNAGTVIRRLLTITGAEAEKLQGIFGVSFKDIAGNARPLVDVLEEVNQATSGLGTADRAAKFNEAFGLLGITAASAIGDNIGSIRDLQEALQNAGGSAAEAAQKMDAGLGGSLRRLLAGVENVAITLGGVLAPTLQKLAGWMQDVTTRVSAWIEANRELVVLLASILTGVGLLGTAMVALGAVSVTVSLAMSALAGLIGTITSAFLVLASPLGVAVTSITALGASFVYASGLVPQLITALEPLMASIKAIGAAVATGDFRKAWDIAVAAIKFFASVALDAFTQLPSFASYAAGRITGYLIDAFQKAWDWIIESSGKVFAGILNAAASFGAELLDAIFTGDIGPAMAKLQESIARTLLDITSNFQAGLGGGPAPEFVFSDRTKGLLDDLKKRSELAKPKEAKTPYVSDMTPVVSAKEKPKLPSEPARKTDDGRVFVSFSADALAAQGNGGSEQINLSRQALIEAKKLNKLMSTLVNKFGKGLLFE